MVKNLKYEVTIEVDGTDVGGAGETEAKKQFEKEVKGMNFSCALTNFRVVKLEEK
jgi:hypothetical protein